MKLPAAPETATALQNCPGALDGSGAREAGTGSLLRNYSIEVMPRTAARIKDFRALLPDGTRVYIAHLEGTPIEDMVETAGRIARDGFAVMPHFPARIIPDTRTLKDWITRYRGEAGINQALLLAGGAAEPSGAFHSSMQLIETGLFDANGFKRLHVAGHPEGNRDIDRDGTERNAMDALRWKQAFSERTDARMAIVTQFAFEAAPIIAWVKRLAQEGIDLPVHVGVAGPARLQTLIKFAIACGVGNSLGVLQRRARDLTKLVRPFEPAELISELAAYKVADADLGIERVHFFPLGGLEACANWAAAHGGVTIRPASAA